MRAVNIASRTLPLLLTITSPDAAAARFVHSWGKPGVLRSDYKADAIACSLRAASRDVTADQETTSYVRGFEVLERENNMPPMARPQGEEGLIAQANRNVLLKRIYAPDRHRDKLQEKLQGEVEACLTARGYTRFRLSREQSKILMNLPTGSPERREFLYQLGSNADIISGQRTDANGR